MDRFNALGRGMQIMLVAGVLLLIDTFFAWQDFGDGELGRAAESIGVDLSLNAWHGFFGWVMGLLLIVLLAWIVARLAAVDIPLPVSTAMVVSVMGSLIFVCALIKNLDDSESTFWSYLGVVLALLIAVGAWLEVQAAGGIETLKTEATGMRPQSSPPASTPAEPPAQAPQPTSPTPPSAPSETAPPAMPPAPPPEDSPPPSSEQAS